MSNRITVFLKIIFCIHFSFDLSISNSWAKTTAMTFKVMALNFTGLYSPLDQKEHLSISANSSPLYSSDIDDHSSTPKNVMEQEKYLNSQHKRREQGSEKNLYENLEQISSNSDEEVIGIITMEDVMEELLQVDCASYR